MFLSCKRRLTVLLIITSFSVVMFTACETEEEVFDERPLIAVNSYIYELSNALIDDLFIADLKGWSREYYEDDLPFYYDQERREWLAEHRKNLETIRNNHLVEQFPSEEEIAEWEVVIVRGDQEWLLEGDEVNNALQKLSDLFDEVMEILEMIEDAEGELDEAQSKQVLEVLEIIEPRVNEVREVLFRQ